MAAFPKWQYDEFNPPGADYSDPNIVAAYDAFHLRFRNYKESAEKILGSLGLGAEHTVIDMGCGTGAFTLHAAPHCKKIYAVDISAPMLDYVKTQAEQKNLQNIEYHHAGFLTYEHQDALADAAVSIAALHHLPDFWKVVALRRLGDMIKIGGYFLLFDIVYPFCPDEHKEDLDEWIQSCREAHGESFADELAKHVREEYSTYDWILDSMLTLSGFEIQEQHHHDFMYGISYICTRLD